jgi:cyclase
MLKPRLIPCLLLKNGGLVKTVNFKNPKYVGDPINAVRIFNEKEVDELMIIDIDATRLNKEPNFELIKNIANESRMPLCYGGGVKNVEQARKIIGLGVEKVAISSQAIQNPEIIKDISIAIGRQSVVIVLDILKKGIFKKYEIFTHNATLATGINPVDFAKRLENIGVGEIVINSVDEDGMMKGYDLNLIKSIRDVTTVPITALGGAGSLEDVSKLIKSFGVIGAAAGSIFVFKGKYKAVLINYPNYEIKNSILAIN